MSVFQKGLFLSVAGIFSLVPFYHAHAQSPNLPGSADPSRLEERLRGPLLQQDNNIVAPEKMDIDGDIPQAPDGFILNRIVLTGVTAFDTGHFSTLIDEYIGRSVDVNVLNHLAARITQIYREEGYFLSRAVIPQQEVMDGIVKIQVIEGHVGNVIIDDPDALLQKDIFDITAKAMQKIKALDPLHGPTLERYVLLLNDQSGLTVQNILQAPEQPTGRPGQVDIVLKILPGERNIILGYNNHGSHFVGPHQLSASYAQGNILNSFDTLTLQTSTAIPMSEVQFGAVGYSFPLNEEGLSASFLVSYANSEPGFTLSELEVEGDSTSAEATLSYPFIRSRRTNLSAGTTFVFRNSATEFLDEELIDDKTRSLSAFVNYNTLDPFNGYNALNLSVSKGLNILNATETGTENLSRQQGRSDFLTLELDAFRQQDITPELQLVNAVSGQFAPHPLLSAQEFGYGGISYGRAYDPSEITGDQGVSASVELRYTDIDPIPDFNLKIVPLVFYDIGKVWNEDRGAKPQSAASAGFGAYYNFDNTVSGSLQVAYPLTKRVTTPIMNGEKGPRILLSLNASF